MRRSAVALRHVPFEDLGLLAPILQREGWEVTCGMSRPRIWSTIRLPMPGC